MNTPLQPVCPQCGTALPADAPKGLCPRCLAAMNLATETALTGADAVAAQPPLTPQELAPHFPQLEILECMGRGGMGVVYQARQKSLHRLVALKLLAPERVQDPEFAARFAREAQALAALSHPNIVTIHDFGQAGGFYFLLMEFVDGVNLRHLLRSRKLTPEEALAIVPPLCDALQYAHDRGIVHRDIKPENLLLDKEGHVKIADFGIAKMLGGDRPVSSTTEDKAVGTPGYMAPEQKRAPQLVDNRADIYSLGVVFYEMLTGELPNGKLQPPSSRRRGMQIDVRLDEIVLRALEKTPEMRFQTAADLRAEVETIATSASKPAPDGNRAFPPVATSEPSRRWSAKKVAVVILSAIIAIPLVLFLAYLVLGAYRTPRPAANTTAPSTPPVLRAIVSGRLTDRNGVPLGNRVLFLVSPEYQPGKTALQDGPTQPDGTFAEFELPVGAPWQVMIPREGALDGPRSGVLSLPRASHYELEVVFDGTTVAAQVKPGQSSVPDGGSRDPFRNRASTVSLATNLGSLLVVDLWSALRPIGNPMQVRFQGAPLDPAILPDAERKASRPLLAPSAKGTPWKIAWSVKPLSNVRSVGFLLPDAASAQQAAEQVNKLVNGHDLRFRGDVEIVLFDLPKTSRGPYRAWVEFAAR